MGATRSIRRRDVRVRPSQIALHVRHRIADDFPRIPGFKAAQRRCGFAGDFRDEEAFVIVEGSRLGNSQTPEIFQTSGFI